MRNSDILLLELNHRVKNNLQIIVSLINLKKRLLPMDRRDDIRFIEEHVQALAVAYRLVYAAGEMNEVAVGELLGEVVTELRQIAGLSPHQVELDRASIEGTIGLDQAISLGLYAAVVMPPYLDRALEVDGSVAVSAGLKEHILTLSVAGSWPDPVQPDYFRSRLCAAYARQLHAENLSPPDLSELRMRFRLDARRTAITGSDGGDAPLPRLPRHSQ